MVRREGTSFWAKLEATVGQDVERRTPISRVTLSDITERKAAEGLLRASEAFQRDILNSLAAHIAVLDRQGTIIAVNAAWERFARENGMQHAVGTGTNYLDVCRRACGDFREEAGAALAGIRAVLQGHQPLFSLEYPCHSSEVQRWFTMRVTPLSPQTGGVIVSHIDITDRKLAEEETRHLHGLVAQEKDRLSALVNSIPDEIWFADTEGRFTLTNPSASREFSLAATDVTDVRQLAESLEVYRPDGSPRPLAETPPLRALEGEAVRNVEEIVRTPATDELRYRQVNSSPVRDATGNIIGSVSVVRDITDGKRAEAMLRKSEERLLLASQAGGFGTYAFDFETGVGDWSPELKVLLGVGAGDPLPLDADMLPVCLHPDDRAGFLAAMTWANDPHGDGRIEIDYRVVWRDGSVRWLRLRGRTEFTGEGEHRRPRRAAGAAVDITAHRQSEEALRESERRYSALFANKLNAMAHCRVITDEQGWPVDYWILQVNDTYERMIGDKKANIEGRRVRDVFPGVEHSAFVHIGVLGKVALEGGEVLSEAFLETTQQYLLIYAYSPLPGEFTAIFTDITERKRAEILLQQSREQLRALAMQVEAVLGQRGVVQGHDYRGVAVISNLKPVPGSPWFLVTKVDAAEAFAPWRFRSVLILASIFGVVLAASSAIGLVWQRSEKAHYCAQLEVERARQCSEERYRITLMSVGDGVIATDSQGRVELMNPVAENLTGWPQVEARGKPLEDVFRIVHEETRQPVENPVSRVLREGVVVSLANHTALVARDGTERAIADAGSPIRDARGALVGVVLNFRDQTQERESQQALQRLRREWEDIFQAIGHPTVVMDSQHRLLAANRAVAAATGKTAEQLQGLTCYQVFHDPCRTGPPEDCPMEQVRISGRTEMQEMEVETLGRTYLVSCTPVADPAGQLQKVIHIATDITLRKQTEQDLRASLAEKTALLSEVHHRVKNNLQIVVSLLNLQASGTQEPGVREVLADAGHRVRSIALLHELLYRSPDLARINFARYAAELCIYLLRCHGSVAERVRIERRVERVDLPLQDAVPCGLIINELVTNALKHGFPEGRAGNITLELRPEDGQRIVLRVSDDGVSMSAEAQLQPIAGLGLRLVSNLATQLEGELTVERPATGGAAFRVTFPLPASRGTLNRTPTADAEAGEANRQEA